MKYLSIGIALLLTGCQATPTLCEVEPNTLLCDSSSYNVATVNALTIFESRAGRKAFALGKTYNGGEFYGFQRGTAHNLKQIKEPWMNVKKDSLNMIVMLNAG